MPSTARSDAEPTIYPVTDEMGEGSLERFVSELLRGLVVAHLVAQGRRAFVGANQSIDYEQYNSKACVAPDVYVLDGVDPNTDVPVWKVWETGVRPSFALEVVSGDVYEDYVEVIRRYEVLRPAELVVFDPKSDESEDRVRWQIWRPVRSRFSQVEATDADRVRSKALRSWLRCVGAGPSTRVRLATGPQGAPRPDRRGARRSGAQARGSGGAGERGAPSRARAPAQGWLSAA